MATINNITQILQDDIRGLMQSFCWICRECADIYEVYWNTDANTVIAAVEGDATAVTSTTKLTKAEFTNGIVTIENFTKFCNNQSVSTTDHLSHCHNLIYGTATPTTLNSLIESIADRMKVVCQAMVDNYNTYLKIDKLYNENEVADIVAVLDAQRVIFGASMTQSDLNSAMTLLSEFKDFMTNAAVTQGNYVSTIAKWNMY